MLKCDKGSIRMTGDIPEIIADWQTITTVIYKRLVEAGAEKEEVNQMFTKCFFESVATATRLLEKEAEDE